MDKKNLLQKFGTGIFGISIIGSLFFSCSNPQKSEKYNNLARRILMTEDSTDNILFNTCPSVKTLDSLIDNSEKYIEKKEFYSKEELEKISKKIYSEISGLNELKDREDQCYRNSLIYFAIGNVNKIQLNIIDIPEANHIYIKYSPINKESFNIETTTGEIQESRNGKYSDNYYIGEFALTKSSLEKNASLRKLNEKELLSLAYTQIAVNFLEKNKKQKNNLKSEFFREKAIEKCNRAIQLDSASQSAYITLGIAESMKEEFPVSYEGNKKAIKCFEKALKINPSANIYYLIGNSYGKLSQREKAIKNYTNALNLIYELRKEFNKPASYLRDLETKCLFWREHMYEILGNSKKDTEDKKS